ncbi:MAG: histidine phosphatase family protein [Candidatus Yanofskybacteria bacterium]|nr:histidine phosphatase family protein [Candidatus Yanofskybacteria bacterium]
MKWPNTVSFIRHGESAYNLLRQNKHKNPLYQEFTERFDKEFAKAEDHSWVSPELKGMAQELFADLKLDVSDYGTSLTETGREQAEKTGRRLLELIPVVPDVIFVSPYLRTRQTLEGLMRGCPALKEVKIVSEERIREQEHGLSTVYNDWRVYLALNPVQGLLFKLEGDYEYRFLNGENKADVRDRARSFLATLVREYSGKNALIVSHHLTLLAMRSNLERWDREQFIQANEEDRPINCGVTIYRGDPAKGSEGHLVLDKYNVKLY